MATKHYFTSIAGRPMTISGYTIKFLICSLQGGKAVGVYETSDPGEIAALDAAVAGRRGVRAISAEEFEASKKKAQMTRPSWNSSGFRGPRVIRVPTLPEMSVEPRAGVPSAGSRGDDKNGDQNLLVAPPISKLVRIERVNPPRPFGVSDQKTQKASARADRAKVRVARRPADTA